MRSLGYVLDSDFASSLNSRRGDRMSPIGDQGDQKLSKKQIQPKKVIKGLGEAGEGQSSDFRGN